MRHRGRLVFLGLAFVCWFVFMPTGLPCEAQTGPDSWSEPHGTPDNVAIGGSLTPLGTSLLYALRGNGTQDFWRYSIVQDEWTALAPIPQVVKYGGTLIAAANNLFAFCGAIAGPPQGTPFFYKYSPVDNAWTQLADVPGSDGQGVGAGAVLAYPGSGDMIYALRGRNTVHFLRYSISANEWTQMPDAPWTGGGRSAVAGENGLPLYFLANPGPALWRYDIGGGTWQQMANFPSDNGTSILYPGTGDFIYGFKSGWYLYNPDGTPLIEQSQFFRYSIGADQWSELAKPPAEDYAQIGTGIALAYPGVGSFLYCLRAGWWGNYSHSQDFWRYSITTDSWGTVRPIDATAFFDTGDMAPGETPDILYVLPGCFTRDFFRYTVATDAWDMLASAPAPYFDGGLVYGGDGYVYVLQGYGSVDELSQVFWRYSITDGVWEQIAHAPHGVQGAGMVCPDGGDYIYALLGDWDPNPGSLRRYSKSQNLWFALAQPPWQVAWGKDLIYLGSGDSLYTIEFTGTGEDRLWCYHMTTNNWELLSMLPGGAGGGYGLCYPASGDFLYYMTGNITRGFWRYSLSAGTWWPLTNTPGAPLSGALAYPGAGNYLYAFPGDSRVFWRYRLPADFGGGGATLVAESSGGGGVCMLSTAGSDAASDSAARDRLALFALWLLAVAGFSRRWRV